MTGPFDYTGVPPSTFVADLGEARQNGNNGGDPLHTAASTQSSLGAIPVYPTMSLPGDARALVTAAGRAGLPEALVGGAALAAMAAAIGGNAQMEVTPSWHERAIVWVPLLAPRGAGKSPAQELAFAPLRDHDEKEGDEGDRILLDDMTLEALARELNAMAGAGAFDLDELSVLLRGLGEYKGRSGDRGRFLKLWTGGPWGFKRVGTGKATNAVRLHVDRPTVIVCGGLQPHLHELLGPDDDGMRPRWLPHLADMPEPMGLVEITSLPWHTLIGRLLNVRGISRTWTLNECGRKAFERHRRRWKEQARDIESPTVEGALTKADVHLARIALVFAEADQPGAGTVIGSGTIDRAAKHVEFSLNCWRALPEQASLALTQRERILDPAVDKLFAWIERRPKKCATAREIQRACVAGARTKEAVAALLRRYEDTFPGCTTTETSNHGGPPTVVYRAPRRERVDPIVGAADSGIRSDQNPHEHWGSSTVGTADSVSADSGNADSEQMDLLFDE